MEYIIDSANLESIKSCMEYFPVVGVTTNPTIITREKAEVKELLLAIRNLIGDKMLHVQVTSSLAEDMVEEAVKLDALLGPNFFVKIPVTKEGIKAIRLVKEKGIRVTATAIFNQTQALMAAVAGADYVAPYVNKIDSIAGCSANVIAEIVTLFEAHNLDTRVLAASFRNAEQVHQVALAGGRAATMRPEMFMELISHPFTNIAVENFDRDWMNLYGKNIGQLIGE